MLIILALATTTRAQRNNIHAKKLQLALYAIENLYVDTTSERELVEDAYRDPIPFSYIQLRHELWSEHYSIEAYSLSSRLVMCLDKLHVIT